MLTLFKEIFIWWNRQTLGTRLHTFFFGKFVGVDNIGNKYYKSKSGKRWVIYKDEIDASKIPEEWYSWIHFTNNKIEDNHNLADVVSFSSCKSLFGLTGACFVGYNTNPKNKIDSFMLDINSHINSCINPNRKGSCTMYTPVNDDTIPYCKSCSLIKDRNSCIIDNKTSLCGWGEIEDVCNVLGNIKYQTLLEIWLSEIAMKSRIGLCKGKRNFAPCNVCDVSGSLMGDKHSKAWVTYNEK